MGNRLKPHSLYRPHELTIRTLYAEVKERATATGDLLPGTPGSLVKRSGTGHEYWYRSYYPVPKKRSEDFVAATSNAAAYEAMRDRIAHSEWTAHQVATLSKLGFQVADKGIGRVLVELYNRKIFDAGLVMVGTLAYMSWLNEYGALATAARTQDIDLARRQPLKLAATVSFLATLQATQLPFVRIPSLPSQKPSTSVKLPGAGGLRVDMLAPGRVLGNIVAVPELAWHAQAIPFYDYLLEDSHSAAMLAGGHCIPIVLPEAARMMWHKLYSSAHRSKDPTKAEKDLVQAATLAAILVEQESRSLRESFQDAPRALRAAAIARRPRMAALLTEHPQALDAFQSL